MAHLFVNPELFRSEPFDHVNLQGVIKSQAPLILLPAELPRRALRHMAVRPESVLHGGLWPAIAGSITVLTLSGLCVWVAGILLRKCGLNAPSFLAHPTPLKGPVCRKWHSEVQVAEGTRDRDTGYNRQGFVC